jgi:hypothetical protein
MAIRSFLSRPIEFLGLAFASMCLWGPAHAAPAPEALPAATGFVVNRGQMDPSVLFYATGPNAAVFFTRTAVVIDQWQTEGPARIEKRVGVDLAPPLHRRGRSVWIRFDGGRAEAAAEGVGQLPMRLNFLYGQDPTDWHTDVPAYSRVVYRDLWPGIDLTYAIEGGRVTCTPVAREGADPRDARFIYEGAAGDMEGLDPSNADRRIGRSGVAGRDDASRLLWSTFLGGTSEEIAWSVTVDADDQPVVAGVTFSTAFPTTPGAYDRTYQGLGDVFVSKLSADGSQLLWSTFLGGTAMNFDYGYAVALDPLGNPMVTGYTWSSDFPVTPGAYDTSFNGGVDVFVSKLSQDGSQLLWGTYLGGLDYDIGYAINTDSEGNPLVAGRTLSPDFPTTPGAYDTSPNGEEDAFVSVLTGSGDILSWSTLIGGNAYDGASALEVGPDGAPVVIGYSASADFPGNGFAGGLYDGFACKVGPDGSELIWTRLFGGSGADYGNGLALDSNGDIFVCGETGSPDFPVTDGAFDVGYNGDDDVYVAKLKSDTGTILWATFLGGTVPFYETAFGIDIDETDRPIVTGSTPASDFPTTADGYDTSHNGASDAWIARLASDGSALDWSSFLGGSGDDYGLDLVVSGLGQAIVVGIAGDATFPSTDGAYDPNYNGDFSDVFVARLLIERDPAGAEEPAPVASTAFSVRPNPIQETGRITYTLASAGRSTVDVVDVAGRVVRRFRGGDREAGAHSVLWDGRDETGELLPAGRYFARIRADGAVRILPIAIVR